MKRADNSSKSTISAPFSSLYEYSQAKAAELDAHSTMHSLLPGVSQAVHTARAKTTVYEQSHTHRNTPHTCGVCTPIALNLLHQIVDVRVLVTREVVRDARVQDIVIPNLVPHQTLQP